MNSLESLFFVASFLIVSTTAHYDSAYFRHGSDFTIEQRRWMQGVSSGKMLSQLAIPGTHDSSAFGPPGNDILYTQGATFSQQLIYGIRFFDIRVKHFSNKLGLVHGIFFFNLYLSDFLYEVDKFLRENPSECVMFRLKQDADPTSNSQSALTTLNNYLSPYIGRTYLNNRDPWVTLGAVRGKFIIFYDNNEFQDHGLNYEGFVSQDVFSLGSNWDLYSKWEKVKAQLELATNGNPRQFYINYLSASGMSFPYFVASGHSSPWTSASRLATGYTTPGWNLYPDFPRLDCLDLWFTKICTIAFEGTNILTRNYLKLLNGKRQKRSVGVIMADFPGQDLISEIIRNNWTN